MSERQFKTYGLNGEPESRLQQELENLHKGKLDAQLKKNFSVPNVSTGGQLVPVLVKDSGKWYIYIRIDDTWHRAELTAV